MPKMFPLAGIRKAISIKVHHAKVNPVLPPLSYSRLAAGKGRHAYIPIKMASGVQDITCVFVEVAGNYEENFVSWDGV